MAVIEIGGKRVSVPSSFLSLPPDQQQATVDEIAKSLNLSAPAQTEAATPQTSFDDRFKGEAPKAKDVGQLGALVSGVDRGLTANFNDEIAGARAAATAGMNPITQGLVNATPIGALGAPLLGAARLGYDKLFGDGNGDASQAYALKKGEINQFSKDAQEQYPVTSTVGEIGGGMLIPGGAAARGTSLAARIGRGAATGSLLGGLSGAGEGEGLKDTAMRAGTGAVLGGAVGAVAPPLVEGVLQGGSAALRGPINTIRGAFDPEGEASRRVVGALQRDFDQVGPTFTREEAAIARMANSPTAVIDAGGETTRALARSSANTSPEAREALSRLTQDRFGNQNDRTATFVQNLTGANADNPATLEALQDAARRANRPAYDRAYNAAPAVWDGTLEQISQAPAVQDAIRDSTRKGANRAAADGFQPVRNPFQMDENGVFTLRQNPDGSQALPSLQFWDHVKRNLDDQFNSLQRAGRNSEARDVGDLRAQLINRLDNQIPEYRAARQGAAQAFGAQDALEAGASFVTSKMDNQEARRAFQRMSPAERQLFQQGFASTLINQVRELGDRRTVLNTIAQSPAARERLEIALGPDRARELEAFLRVEGIMDRARTAVTGNSTTARQLAELGLAGGAGAIAGGFNITDPRTAGTAALVYGLTRGRGAINEGVARRVGEMLASNDPSVFNRGLQVIARNASVFNRLRAIDGVAPRVSGSQSPKNLIPQGAMPASAQDEQP